MSLGTAHSAALRQSVISFAAAKANDRQTLAELIISVSVNTTSLGDALARNPLPFVARTFLNNFLTLAVATFCRFRPDSLRQTHRAGALQ